MMCEQNDPTFGLTFDEPENVAAPEGTAERLVGIETLHPEAFGLTRQQHRAVVDYALNNFAEAWISEKLGISQHAVREICASENVVPARNELINGKWESTDAMCSMVLR